MSRAKNKRNTPALKSVEQRIKDFEAGMVELIKAHQVGLRPYNDKYGPKLEYVDLVQLAEDAKANKAAK